MVRVQTKLGQLAPSYEGPYTIVRKNQGNSYVLRDVTGVLTPRNYTSIELKLISKDEVIELDDEGNEIKHFEIEAIINHRGDHRHREYLVRWKNYSSEWDEWVSAANINATETLRTYWKKLGVPYKPKKNAKYTYSPTSSITLKKNPPGSISQFIDSLDSDTSADLSSLDGSSLSIDNQPVSSNPFKRAFATSGNNPSTKRKRVGTRRSKRRTDPQHKN
jgi:hypothetical protein